MKKSLSVLFVLLSLTGCSEQSSIENAVRENLKDPESAKFRNAIVSKNSTRACVEWNSKNSFGGYGEWDVTRLNKENGAWAISVMQVPSDSVHSCTQEALDRAESTEEAARRIINSQSFN